MSVAAIERPAIVSRLTALEWALVGATFLAPLRISVVRAYTLYDVAISVLAAYLLITRSGAFRPGPRSLVVAAGVLFTAGLYSAFRSTLPMEAVNMDLQYAFIFFVQLPVIVALARRPAAVEANIVAFVVGFAVVAALSAATGEVQSAGRAVTYYTDNANALGVPAAFVTPLALAIATQRWREGHRTLAVVGSAIVIGVLLWAVAASASRGATIATFVSTALYFVFAGGIRLGREQLRRVAAVVAVVALAVVLFFTTPLFPQKLKDRIVRTLDTTSETTVVDDRVALDRAGLNAFTANPIVGTGFDNFRYVSQFYDPGATEHDPHNLVIQFLATTGIVGAVAALFIIGRWFVMMFRVARWTISRAQREIVWSLFCGFVGIMIVGVATPVIVLRPYWVVYGLGLAAVAAGRRREVEINDASSSDSSPAHRLRILHLIVSLGSTNTEYNEHCLPMRRDRDVSVCSFTRAAVEVPEDIELFEGDGTYTGFWRVLRGALRAHDYDIVHVHAPRTAAMLLLASASLGRPMKTSVATLHNSWENFKPLARPVLFVIAATFGATVSCGRSADESMPRALKRLAGSRWHVVQNGTDIDRVEAAIATMPSETDPSAGRRTVSWVGRMLQRKDPFTMLDAVARLGEDVDVVFIGDGEELPRLRAEVERRGLGGRVRLLGLLGREDVYREIARSDVFVSTSAGEGLPVAVLEAMAVGAPVVLSDIPPHREIEGAEIRFVPVGDATGFARAIADVLALPVNDRVALGRLGKEVVMRGFSLEAMHTGYEHVYRELMPGGSAPDREPTRLQAGAT